MISKCSFIALITLFSAFSFSQNKDSTFVFNKNGLNKPSIVSTHPYGILFLRGQGNFQIRPYEKSQFSVNLESGNVWSPPVTAYIPNKAEDRKFISQFPWHAREFQIDVDTLDAKTLEAQNDGVIKGLRLNMSINLNKKSELKIGMRSFLLTRGKFPFSIFTNDETIEFFHDNIAGGEDPFDRKIYPLNEAKIRYKDRDNRVMEINNGDFILSGFEFSYNRYTTNLVSAEKEFYLNYGIHLGVNTSSFNQSIDFGASVNTIKQFSLRNKRSIGIGTSIGLTKNNLINLNSNNMNFSSNNFIGYFEGLLEYSFISKNKIVHSVGFDFYLQTSLNKKSEFDYLIPTKNGTSFKSWNTGTSNLYRNNNYWTFIYSFTGKITTILYLQQDLTVNNNPDIQTGVNVSFKI